METRIEREYNVNHHLTQTLKLIGMDAFNYLIYILTKLNTNLRKFKE